MEFQLFDNINSFTDKYLTWFHIPRMGRIDFVEIIIISFLIYNLMVWFRQTRAWALTRGIIVILGFVAIAVIFKMNTIIWIVGRVFGMAIVALIVVFQPELRRALESLGQHPFLSGVNLLFDSSRRDSAELFSDDTKDAIISAAFAMGKEKTGALIVIQNKAPLVEYGKTGITIDSKVSSQLLINIFEHNTPLHDGAVIISGDRIASATCYLPLSENRFLSKELGTRHRAAVGISEVTDSLTVIVSEETGKVSVAKGGEIYRNLSVSELRDKLDLLQNKTAEESRYAFWKGWSKNEKVSNK